MSPLVGHGNISNRNAENVTGLEPTAICDILEKADTPAGTIVKNL